MVYLFYLKYHSDNFFLLGFSCIYLNLLENLFIFFMQSKDILYFGKSLNLHLKNWNLEFSLQKKFHIKRGKEIFDSPLGSPVHIWGGDGVYLYFPIWMRIGMRINGWGWRLRSPIFPTLIAISSRGWQFYPSQYEVHGNWNSV